MKKFVDIFGLIIAGIASVVIIITTLLVPPIKLNQVGLGIGTLPYFPNKFGLPIQGDSVSTVDFMKENIQKNGTGKRVVLWLGNSQLFGINQYRRGEVNSTEILFDSLYKYNKFVVAYSIPNANLQEHYVIFKYCYSKFRIDQLIIPVFFDDLRETGLRDDLLQPCVGQILAKDTSNSELDKYLFDLFAPIHSDGANSDTKALNNTTQELAERYLSSRLSSKSLIWADRAEIRSNIIYNYLFKYRNSLLGITPVSKRKRIPARYLLNMQCFEKINEFARDNDISVIVYIPPIRNDLEQPYVTEEYKEFKADLFRFQKRYGFKLLNAENIVPANDWGMKQPTTLNAKSLEIDFMHFKAEGHLLLADTIASLLQKNAVE